MPRTIAIRGAEVRELPDPVYEFTRKDRDGSHYEPDYIRKTRRLAILQGFFALAIACAGIVSLVVRVIQP